MYSCDAKLIFQSSILSLQCHMIIQKLFKYADLMFFYLLLLAMLKKLVLFRIFVENVMHFFQDYLMNLKFEKQHLF